MISDILRTVIFVIEAHKGQVDKSGDIYVKHPIRVAMRLSSPVLMQVALLHDVLEDTSVTERDIEVRFGKEVLGLVKVLTRRKDEPYITYIRRVAKNKSARLVKLADISDNTTKERLSKLSPEVRQRLEKKYKEALEVLV